MTPCPVRFPILSPGDAVTLAEGLGISTPPKYLTCDLEADHGGRHHDPVVGWWQFVPFLMDLGELPDHPNCKCAPVEPLGPQLPTVDTAVRLPAWWVAERADQLFGDTSPQIFFPLER